MTRKTGRFSILCVENYWPKKENNIMQIIFFTNMNLDFFKSRPSKVNINTYVYINVFVLN